PPLPRRARTAQPPSHQRGSGVAGRVGLPRSQNPGAANRTVHTRGLTQHPMKTPEICIEEGRREKVRAANLNGLDYVEVKGDEQRTLEVYFLGKAPAPV